MHDDKLLVLTSQDVETALSNQETAIIELVRSAYVAHENGKTSLPHSVFLRFADKPRDRIIALPAYLHDEKQIAGIKWVSSFPQNIAIGKRRASATMILNDTADGRAYCVLESSQINVARTAASAALAADILSQTKMSTLLLIGCGPINQAIARYILTITETITTIKLYDVAIERAEKMANSLQQTGVTVKVLKKLSPIKNSWTIVSIATNVSEPTFHDPAFFGDACLILHISLRDLSSEIIANAYNIVDDVDHVNREQTSVHLTSQLLGHTEFIKQTIGNIAKNSLPDARSIKGPIVFSPFGLGILDLTVARFIYEIATKRDIGTFISKFHPARDD